MDTDGRRWNGSLDHALDDVKLGKTQWKIWFLSGMGVFMDGFDLFIIGVALPLIEQDLSLSSQTLGLIGAAAPLGAVAGAAIAGPLTDRWGRKILFLIDLMFFVVFSLLSALAWNAWSLIAFRLLLGVGIGADYPISSTYISEFMPARIRGRMIVGAFSFQALGSIAGAAVGLLILLVAPSLGGWRWMLAMGVVPAVIIVLMRSNLPESPRWYLSQGKSAQAAAVFSQMGEQTMPGEASSAQPLPYRALFSGTYIRRLILATVPWFLMDIALYGIGIFTPTILAVLNFSDSDGMKAVSFVQKDIRATAGSLFLDIFLIIGFAIAIWLIEKWGRIRLQLLGFAGMTFGLLFVAWGAVGNQQNLLLIFTGFALFNLLVNMGPNATTFTLPAELFPTSLRASGHGLASSCGKIGAAVGIFLLPILQDSLGLTATMLIVAGSSLCGFLVTWICQVETKGHSLEELEVNSKAVSC